MKIVICVFACATIERYKLELLKVVDTWGRHAKEKGINVFYFMGGEQTDLIGDNYIYLDGVENSYQSASDKQNLGLKYIYEKEHPDYTLVCGTDTYVHVDNLLFYCLTNTNIDYIGGGGGNPLYFHMDKSYYYHSGAGFILSGKALTFLYPLLENMSGAWKNTCNYYGRDYLIPACDACISYFLQNGFMEEKDITKEPTLFFGCNYKGYVQDKLCCGDKVNYQKIILCHYMTPNDFDAYTLLIS